MDFRTHEIFSINIRGFFRPDKHFTVVNRFLPGLEEPKHQRLYDEIVEWLNEKDSKEIHT